MIIAALSIFPVGEGTSLSNYVKASLEELKKSGLTIHIGAMATTIEAATLDELFQAVFAAERGIKLPEIGIVFVKPAFPVRHQVYGRAWCKPGQEPCAQLVPRLVHVFHVNFQERPRSELSDPIILRAETVHFFLQRRARRPSGILPVCLDGCLQIRTRAHA